MTINFDTGLLSASLAGGDANIAIKSGSGEPITIVCTDGGDPTEFGGSVVMNLGLTAGGGVQPTTLAFLGAFTQTESTFTGTLDCNDVRLVEFMKNQLPQNLNLEVWYAVDSGPRFIAPNIPVVCQAGQNLGNPSSEGGPNYPTTDEMTAAIAAAIATIKDGSGRILVGTHGRLAPTSTGFQSETSPTGGDPWTPQQSWP